MVNDHYPYEKWLFHWEYTLFSDKPIQSFVQAVSNSGNTKHKTDRGLAFVMGGLNGMVGVFCVFEIGTFVFYIFSSSGKEGSSKFW